MRFDPDETAAALTALVATMERGRSAPWDEAEFGERYAALAARVIAFRAYVGAVVGRFKLGQDERAEVREAIVASTGDEGLARWMRRFAERAG